MQSVKKHLAIFKGDGANLILEGKKTIESRFSRIKQAPYGAISAGDLVYIKPSGGSIIGQFRVKKVIFYDGLDSGEMEEIKKRFGNELAVDEAYWEAKLDSKYGSLIFIGSSNRFITSPINLPKKDLRGWVVLD